MKKAGILLLGIVLFMGTCVYSQANFGIKAGLNLSEMNGKFMGERDDHTKMKIGINAGVVADYYFSDVVGLESGLILESKGFEYRYDEDGDLVDKADYGKLKTNVLYLDIPINLKAQYDLGNARIFGQFGPYIGFALSGKMKTTGDLKDDMEEMGFDTEESLDFGNSAEDDNLKRFDFGLMFGVGVGVSNVEFGAGYDFGLANILPGGDSDNYIRNGVLKFSVAYFFGNKSPQPENPEKQ